MQFEVSVLIFNLCCEIFYPYRVNTLTNRMSWQNDEK